MHQTQKLLIVDKTQEKIIKWDKQNSYEKSVHSFTYLLTLTFIFWASTMCQLLSNCWEYNTDLDKRICCLQEPCIQVKEDKK